MSFTSSEFLLCFLPIVFFLYVCCWKYVKIQNILLLIASLVFYAFYDIKYIIFLVFSIMITYLGGILFKKTNRRAFSL